MDKDLKNSIPQLIKYIEDMERDLRKAKERNKKLINGLTLISTFVCIPDEDTEEQVMATHRMCGDLLKEVDGHWED